MACVDVNELRALRRSAGLSQRQLADLLDIPLEHVPDVGQWPATSAGRTSSSDSRNSRRRGEAARTLATGETGQRTRRAHPDAAGGGANRKTQDAVQRAVGIRPPDAFRLADAGEQFIVRHYRCFGGQEICPAPLPTVPDDYDKRLRDLRAGEASPKAPWRDA